MPVSKVSVLERVDCNRMHCNKGVLTLCNSQKADSVESNPVKPLALVPGKENVWLTYAMTYHLN